jgi:hypothetical protein
MNITFFKSTPPVGIMALLFLICVLGKISKISTYSWRQYRESDPKGNVIGGFRSNIYPSVSLFKYLLPRGDSKINSMLWGMFIYSSAIYFKESLEHICKKGGMGGGNSPVQKVITSPMSILQQKIRRCNNGLYNEKA